MLLARYIDIGRETQDLDFAVQQMSNETGAVQTIFNDIVSIDLEDGFVFMNPLVEPLEHFHMQYPGARIRIEVRFGNSKFSLFIDLGFGDVVQVSEKEFLLLTSSKGPLFEASLRVKCYPIEFVFAEKLETIAFRGANNSRMKDFHDLYTLVHSGKMLNRGDVMKAVHSVFEHRKTALQLPLPFDSPALEALQRYWGRYSQSTTAPIRLPHHITDIIAAVNHFTSNVFAEK